jgi:hypothetical protein
MNGGVSAPLCAALGRTRQLPRPAERPGRYPKAGLVLLRSRPEDGAEIWCRCDGGPHGFLSIAAHAHADALSLEVRHDGVDIFADPGTYCYHGEPDWRQWFRSTAAHNTIEVGGVSQSESGGPFLWNTHATTRTLARAVGNIAVQTWSAEHDGYRRLSAAATHRRSVRLNSPGRRLTVIDEIDAAAPVDAVLSWHLGPQVGATLVGARADLFWSVGPVERWGKLTLPAELSWTAHRGEVDPISGWYSPRFGHRVPAITLVGRGRISQSRLITELELP